MCAAVLDSLVSGFEDLEPAITLPDPDDRHVVAAAIRAGAGLIVTFNLRDFSDAEVAALAADGAGAVWVGLDGGAAHVSAAGVEVGLYASQPCGVERLLVTDATAWVDCANAQPGARLGDMWTVDPHAPRLVTKGLGGAWWGLVQGSVARQGADGAWATVLDGGGPLTHTKGDYLR